MEGFIGGAVAALSIWPLETIRTQKQTLVKSNFKEVFYNIYKKQGVIGFYKGVSYGIKGIGTFYGIYFYLYEHLKKDFNPFVASYTAACFGSFCNNGFNVLRTRHQTEVLNDSFKTKKYPKSAFDLIKDEGTKGWCRGLMITCIKNVELGGIMSMREKLKNDHNLSPFVSTFLSKVTFGTLSYPFDTLRTLSRNHTKGDIAKIMIKRTITNPSSLYNGCLVYMFRSVPSTLIAFTVHDYLKRLRK